MSDPLLSVQDLAVSIRTKTETVQAVDGVSFDLRRGEIVGIVGESGSGKSVTALTLLGLTRGHNAAISGRAILDGTDLITSSERELRRVRGKRIAMIFQDPMTALNPLHRVGAQIVEQIRAHDQVSKEQATTRAVDLLARVGIPSPAERAHSFPHEFSGGMRQRVMIAMAMSCAPEILIADEPTTALDVTIQAQILAEVNSLRADTGVAVLLITHDLGVVAEVADQVVVMYAGRVVEQGSLDEIFYDPLHPYTWGLLGSVPRPDKPRPDRLPTIPGAPPSFAGPPAGCAFAPRCPWRTGQCDEPPPLRAADPATPDHLDRCWLDLPSKRGKRLVGDEFGLPTRPTGGQTDRPTDGQADGRVR
jgi:oligopeptide/dipeptide ABC transporter ATP-binding protein